MLLALVAITATSCQTNSVDRKQKVQQEQMLQQADAQVGMPAIKNFQERKLMKQIFELRDDANLICYCYLVPEVSGKPVFLGKCIGYGIPAATQFTNPEKCTLQYSEAVTLPQADPNGLFMPTSTDATWVMLINPKTGEPTATYIEPKVLITQFEL